MGKYMRKCREAAGEEVAGVEVTQIVGVRTRSRSAAAPAAVAGGVVKVAPRRKKAPAPAPVNAVTAGELGAGGDGGSCYIKLRSRTLFMAPPQQPSAPRAPVPAEASGAGLSPALAAGLSRCSSTASSVDVRCQDWSLAYRSDAAEAGGDHILELSASNSGSGPDRERRETTPSSRAHGGEVSDLESDLAGQKNSRPLPVTTSVAQLITPPAEEIRAFFAAAEKAQAERFAAKYNFDVVRGVPLDGGRFEWTPVVSI